jgi:hypothetical protein
VGIFIMSIVFIGRESRRVYSAKRKEWYLANEKVYEFIKNNKKIKQENSYIIYALTDPTNNNIFYIGSTKNLNNRYKQHLICGCNLEKSIIIKNLMKNNIMPDCIILEGFEDEKLSRLVEKSYIKFYKKINKNLTNIH